MPTKDIPLVKLDSGNEIKVGEVKSMTHWDLEMITGLRISSTPDADLEGIRKDIEWLSEHIVGLTCRLNDLCGRNPELALEIASTRLEWPQVKSLLRKSSEENVISTVIEKRLGSQSRIKTKFVSKDRTYSLLAGAVLGASGSRVQEGSYAGDKKYMREGQNRDIEPPPIEDTGAFAGYLADRFLARLDSSGESISAPERIEVVNGVPVPTRVSDDYIEDEEHIFQCSKAYIEAETKDRIRGKEKRLDTRYSEDDLTEEKIELRKMCQKYQIDQTSTTAGDIREGIRKYIKARLDGMLK